VWEEVLNYDGIEGQAGKALSIFELGINCATEDMRESFPKASDNLETTNLSVRRAIAMATEKDYIVDDVMEGLADVGTSIIPTATTFWHWNVSEEDRWDYDLDRANATLEAAGYIHTDDDGIRENSTSGVELTFSFYYRTTSPDDREAAMRISAALDKIGIHTEPAGVSEMVMYNLWLGCQMDLFIWAWDTDVDPNFMLSTQTTSQIPLSPQDWTKWSDSFWSNETYDELYERQQFTVDLEERQAIIFEMQELLYDQCPYVVLYYPFGLYAYTVEKFTNYPDWVENPGMTPGTMWFFFEVTPVDDWVDPMPPENVYAGADQWCIVGDTLWFAGSATDMNDEEETLNWTWTFIEPDETENLRYGKTVSYQFDQVGEVGVMLVVTDPGGEAGVDDLIVTVLAELGEDDGLIKGFVVDQDSELVFGATVTAGNQTRTTGDDGGYSMLVLAGPYTVNATMDGYQMDSVEVTVVAGEITWANLTLTLTSGTLIVRVLDSETGDSIASAVVNVTYGAFSDEYLTQSTGNATFRNVDAGLAEVKVSKAGYEANSTNATVVAGETTVVVVELTPEPEEPRSNTLLIAAIAIGILVVILIAAMMLMKKRKAGSGDNEPPPP
ncbi:MAG: ABC transporter substrate-binding protein, partial [Thermoplasmata archaeon]